MCNRAFRNTEKIESSGSFQFQDISALATSGQAATKSHFCIGGLCMNTGDGDW